MQMKVQLFKIILHLFLQYCSVGKLLRLLSEEACFSLREVYQNILWISQVQQCYQYASAAGLASFDTSSTQF